MLIQSTPNDSSAAVSATSTRECLPICHYAKYYVQVDSAASELYDIFVELRQMANGFSPINRIPNELLVMIFKDVQGPLVEQASLGWTERFNSTSTKSYNETRRVVVLSHVCRHWRQTALRAPTLWARVDGRSLDRLDTFMERARSVHVTLFLRSNTPEELATFLDATSAKRLRRVDITLKDLTEVAIVPLATWAVPDLECLVLLTWHDSYDDARPSLAPVQLLAGRTHALKALALQYIGSWIPSNTFPSLTHLHMCFAFSTEAQTSEILAVLSSASMLEFIHIGQLLRRQDSDLIHETGPVVLSRLRRLTIVRYAYTRAMNLLEHLSLPEKCFVCLDELVITPTEEGHPRRLVDIGPLHNATRLDFASGDDEVLLVADSDTSGFWLKAQIKDNESTWDLWSYNLPTMITLSTITSLHINIYTTHAFWPSVLPHFTAVVELKVSVGSPDPDPDFTSPLDVLCATLSGQPVLLPSLRVLYIQGPYFNRNLDHFLSALVDMVAFRAFSGHRLQRFILQPSRQLNNLDRCRSATATIGRDVDEFQLVGAGPGLCRFEMRDIWNVEGAEKYWQPHTRDRPTRHYVVPSEAA